MKNNISVKEAAQSGKMNKRDLTRKVEKCFAKNKYGNCTILVEYIKKDCRTCPFFKTEKQFKLGRRKALKKLKKLSLVTRRHIADKYSINFEVLDIPQQSIDRGPTK